MCGQPPTEASPLRCAALKDLAEVALQGRGFSRVVMSFLENAAFSPKT
jgi:hypothetical protein